MSKLRRMIQSVSPGSYGSGGRLDPAVAPEQVDATSILRRVNEHASPTTATVVRINNGFIVTQFIYNPSGPDGYSCTYAATLEDLAQALVGTFAAQRLKT